VAGHCVDLDAQERSRTSSRHRLDHGGENNSVEDLARVASPILRIEPAA
jgi:hypothetical protein